MRDEQLSSNALKTDGKWVFVAYGFFVVFHFLPTILVVPIRTVSSDNYLAVVAWFVAGSAGVSFMIGYRAERFVVIETTIALMLYMVTLFIELHWGPHLAMRPLAMTFIGGVSGIFLAMGMSWLGTRVRERAERLAAELAVRE